MGQRSAPGNLAASLARLLVVSLLAAISAVGCGGSHSETITGTSAGDLAPAATDFEPPADLLRRVSFEDADRFSYGADYASELPNQRVTPQGTQLIFQPSWDAGGEPGSDDLAYAMYFFALDGYDDQPELAINWGTVPEDWNCCFVGLGNQVHDRWDWFTDQDISDSLLTLEDLAPYLDGDGGLVMIVLMAGTDSCALGWLRWGGNVAPVAVLEADPVSGIAPLAVSFSATASYDPDGALTDFEWDFDGDGEFNEPGPEEDARSNPAPYYTYNDAGIYTAAVCVTDNDDITDAAEIGISAGGWVIVKVAERGGSAVDLAVIDGCPTVCYITGIASEYTLNCVRSNTATGINESDWSEPIMVDSEVAYASFVTLLEVAGNPAISYSSRENQPSYIRSTTITGASPGDWSQQTTFDIFAYNCAMAVVDGNPALSWGAFHDLCYVRATTPTGASPAEWADHFVVEYAT